MPYKDSNKQREYQKLRMRRWRNQNPELNREQRKRYTKTQNIHRKNSNRKLRLEIIKFLGGQCANPYSQHDKPYTDIRALQIDHIHGNGNKERKRKLWERKGGLEYYRFILEQLKSGSKDYQLLCANCNWIKLYENGEYTQTPEVKSTTYPIVIYKPFALAGCSPI